MMAQETARVVEDADRPAAKDLSVAFGRQEAELAEVEAAPLREHACHRQALSIQGSELCCLRVRGSQESLHRRTGTKRDWRAAGPGNIRPRYRSTRRSFCWILATLGPISIARSPTTNLATPRRPWRTASTIQINTSSNSYYNRGIAYDKMKAYDKASLILRLPSTWTPRTPISTTTGLLLPKAGQVQPCARGLHGGHTEEPWAAGHTTTGLLCWRRNQEAVKDYTIALQLEPQNAIALHNRGVLYERLVRSTGAANSTAISTPKSAISYHARAVLNANRGDKTANDFDIAISIEPSNPLYVKSRAIYNKEKARTRKPLRTTRRHWGCSRTTSSASRTRPTATGSSAGTTTPLRTTLRPSRCSRRTWG